ncbi:MAG: methyltransferase [Planctomycetota bacterium]|nr:methyltransferase [Planctomycetota bacterium]
MLRNLRRALQQALRHGPAFRPPVPPTAEEARDLHARLLRFEQDQWIRFKQVFLDNRSLRVRSDERELFQLLEGLRLVEGLGASIYRPCVRLFPFYGRFIATDLLRHAAPDQVFSLMFEQVYFVRNYDVREHDTVLELCVGSGVNALFAAQAGATVTGVDINPRALAFTRFNAALDPAAPTIQLREGSLFAPLDPQSRFDTILVNPPFELVPEGATWFLHSHGGEDGLDVVRTMLPDVPRFLKPNGRFQIITWSPASKDGPLLVPLLREALPTHQLSVHRLGRAPLEDHMRPFRRHPAYQNCLGRLAERGIDAVEFLYVHTAPSATPGVVTHEPTAEVQACHAIADSWA